MADEADWQPAEKGSGFEDLPDDLLAQITPGSHGFPLLAVSRRGRDAVLERASTIQLKVMRGEHVDVAPTARLLNRACRAAKPGLHLEIKLGEMIRFREVDQKWSSTLLPALLQRGLDSEGWGNVHALSLLMVREVNSSSRLTLTARQQPHAGVCWCTVA